MCNDFEGLDLIREIEIGNMLQEIATAISNVYPSQMFALLMFDEGESDRCNYISNAQVEGVIEALRSTADRLEANRKGDEG